MIIRLYKVNEQVVLQQKAYMLFYKQTINQPSVNSRHQGNELKHSKSTSLNATFRKESLSSVSMQSISNLSSSINIKGTTVSSKEDAVIRKETMLDGYSACKGAQARQNTKLESSNGKHVWVL